MSRVPIVGGEGGKVSIDCLSATRLKMRYFFLKTSMIMTKAEEEG